MKIYCISRVKETERRESIKGQDFLFPVEFSDAQEPTGKGPFATMNACSRSHAEVLEAHFASYPNEPLLILEDDALIKDPAAYAEAIQEVLPEGDCKSLGSMLPPGGKAFCYTQCMLFGPLKAGDVEEFVKVAKTWRSPTEHIYIRVFGDRLTVGGPVIVDVAPFKSSRTGMEQKSIG